MNNEISKLLHRLGITGNYHGFRQLLLAIELVLQDEDRLLAVGDKVYRPVALILGCGVSTVERNIRSVISIAWHTNPRLLRELSPAPLIGPPTVARFIDIIAEHLRRTYQLPRKDRLAGTCIEE